MHIKLQQKALCTEDGVNTQDIHQETIQVFTHMFLESIMNMHTEL